MTRELPAVQAEARHLQALDQLRPVGGHEQGDRWIVAQAAQDLMDDLRRARIEADVRIIEEEEVGLDGERAQGG